MFIAGKITYKLVNFPVPCPIAGSKSSSFLGSIISFGWLKRHRTSERTTLQQSVCPPFSLNSSHVFWLKSHVWWLNIPTLHQPDVLCWDDYIPRQNTGETHIENLWAHEKNIRIRICQKKSYFLRDIPTLTHYSHIVSDIPSGSIYGVIIYIYIHVFLVYLFRHSFFLAFYFDILCGILSGIYPDILSGMYSDVFSGIYSGILSGSLSGILAGIYSDILSASEIWS